MWSSNNEKNRLTKGKGFEIPAGEFRYNVVIPPPDNSDINKDAYIRMQFFDPWYVNYRQLFGDLDDPSLNGFEEDFTPYVANWVESTNNVIDYNSVYSGVFSPILNSESRGGAGLNSKGEARKKDRSLKKLIKEGDAFQFGLKLNNQFFASRLSMGGGWNVPDPSYNYNLKPPVYETRFIGALNIDTNFKDDPFEASSYHKSESQFLDVAYDDLKRIYSNNQFVGAKYAKKIALNIDIRGFSEEDTPGKHAFFIDPANNYYYDNF